MRHPNPTVLLILLTQEVRLIEPSSHLASSACGEAISVDPYGRWPDAEVYCEDCAKALALRTYSYP